MIFKNLRTLLILVGLGIANPCAAQEADDDGPITVLDQVVPVAEAEPSADEPDAADPDISLEEQLEEEFERYKNLNEAGVYDEAENAAKRVVQLAIREYGPDSTETAKALSNLGLVQHRMQNYEAAQQNFQAAIDLISENEDKLSAMLINPMKGLGAAQLEGGRPDLASRTYRQAVHLSHVNEGPHNASQVEVLEALAEAHLRMGLLEDAKNDQDMIYALNVRHYSDDQDAIVKSLFRRAAWQRRTGHVLDERATYRRIIRIIESQHGKDSILLIDPLKLLGESYFYIDTSDTDAYQSAGIASGEMYFKRATRIAEENPESDWEIFATAKLALADYYNVKGDHGRARRSYRDVWNFLSEDPARIGLRRDALETLTTLNEEALPRYIAGATKKDVAQADAGLREGRIVVSYEVNTRGRVSKIKIVEADPADFEDMQRFVTRKLRNRIFRPRLVDSAPVETPNQVFTHTFYYQQDELDKLHSATEAEES